VLMILDRGYKNKYNSIIQESLFKYSLNKKEKNDDLDQ
jgi:hypothetical protein